MTEEQYLKLIIGMIKDDFKQTNRNEVTISKGEFEFIQNYLKRQSGLEAHSNSDSIKEIMKPAAQTYRCCDCRRETMIQHPKQHMLDNKFIVRTRCIDCTIEKLDSELFETSHRASVAYHFIKEKGIDQEFEYFRLEAE